MAVGRLLGSSDSPTSTPRRGPGAGLQPGAPLSFPSPLGAAPSPSPKACWPWEWERWGPSPCSVTAVSSAQCWRDNGVTEPPHPHSVPCPVPLPGCPPPPPPTLQFPFPFAGGVRTGGEAEPKPQPRGSSGGDPGGLRTQPARAVPSAAWQGTMRTLQAQLGPGVPAPCLDRGCPQLWRGHGEGPGCCGLSTSTP